MGFYCPHGNAALSWMWSCGLECVSSQVFPHVRVHLCPVLSGCPVQVERRGLEAHLSECNFRRECPKGCGRMLPSPNQSQHNCMAELRIEVEMLRYAPTLTTAGGMKPLDEQ